MNRKKKELSLQIREKGSFVCLIGRQTKAEKETVEYFVFLQLKR